MSSRIFEVRRELNARLSRVEQDLQRLRAQVPGGSAVGVPAPADQSDLATRMLALERAMEQLTGLAEEARYAARRAFGNSSAELSLSCWSNPL